MLPLTLSIISRSSSLKDQIDWTRVEQMLPTCSVEEIAIEFISLLFGSDFPNAIQAWKPS